MAIIFKNIKYRNFKSVGNAPIEISLDKAKTTLITGKNGCGKSTLTSAICFALFGQDFVLNKNSLINTINQKKLEVELTFEVDKKKYLIHRGIKPHIFKIYENGKLLNEEASMRDYQKILETQILKMDLRAFKQVVVVGGRNYVPFMKLKTNERREFIEDLLDIRVFTTMNVLLKEKIKENKEFLKEIENELKSIKEKTLLQENFVKKLKNEKIVSVGKIERAIADLQEENDSLDTLINDKMVLIENHQSKMSTFSDNLSQKLSELKFEIRNLTTHKSDFLKKIDFYKETEICPTCSQNIDHAQKEHLIDYNQKDIDIINLEIDKISADIQKMENELFERKIIETDILAIEKEVQTFQQKINTNLKLIKSAYNQIEELKNDTNSLDSEKQKLKEFAKKYIEFDKQKKKLLEEQQYNDYVSGILADGGIKTKIIKQYIPTINKLINKYLASLDFWVSFNLDENFNESIKSRYRDTFTYDNFSDGQAARIDLALMLAWRDIAKMRNAVNINIAVFDEADAAVDGEGASLFIDLMNTIEKSNLFIISHKGDLLRDKFERAIEMNMVDNFTVLKEE